MAWVYLEEGYRRHGNLRSAWRYLTRAYLRLDVHPIYTEAAAAAFRALGIEVRDEHIQP